ncbi:hypothetical protein B0T16DRAFT_455143 [Cercophora newfieldiana]|uniref:Uncharacterized protein n=1 Tax=Cercophora newfieldiana TaxID=92897 RepID=A0AA39YJR9_9PEZI|nr:hypothetical protein B0T16DRAFT_455143 [Cercophora newfieldiana]
MSSFAPTSTTSTPLPPLPTSSDACSFEDLDSLIDRAVQDWAGYNMSLLVQTCSEVCEVAFGTGNPDISGPGAMVSYVLQGLASITFGPLLGFLSVFIASEPDLDSYFALPKALWMTEYVLPTATSIHQTNLIIALSVLVSSVKRLQTTTPLAERALITGLVGYQMLAAVIGTASYAITHEQSRGRSFLVTIYMLTVGILYAFVTASKQAYFPARGYALGNITAVCTTDYGWPAVEINLAEMPLTMAQKIAKAQPKRYKYDENATAEFFGSIGLIILLIVIIICILAILQRFAEFLGRALPGPYYAFCQFVGLKPRRVAGIAAVAVWTVLSAFLASLALVALFRLRDQHRQASRDRYADDEWGFGQVMAVMAWIPVFQDILEALIGTANYRWELRVQKKQEYSKLEGGSSDDSDHDEEAASAPQSSSVNTASSQGALSRRETWPRNESGGYLPVAATPR